MTAAQLLNHLLTLERQGMDMSIPVEVLDTPDTFCNITANSVYVTPNDGDPSIDRLVILPSHRVERRHERPQIPGLVSNPIVVHYNAG
jgi:hypothetical protein